MFYPHTQITVEPIARRAPKIRRDQDGDECGNGCTCEVCAVRADWAQWVCDDSEPIPSVRAARRKIAVYRAEFYAMKIVRFKPGAPMKDRDMLMARAEQAFDNIDHEFGRRAFYVKVILQRRAMKWGRQ